eukprot:TRINITY_DN11868_c0_g1_i2.p2 TRINITY_DN11868_c0_g1~~TRINITY_DN11868_c0_g1_i2.p2  ORF type:complete len:117 (-),score=26.07 TRINITY_DN11868_c0_g1_i2:13-363(-)
MCQYVVLFMFFFFSSRRRHTRCREVSWARRCVQETGLQRSHLNNCYYHQAVSYTHLRAHETSLHLVCRLLLEKKKNINNTTYQHIRNNSKQIQYQVQPHQLLTQTSTAKSVSSITN